MSVVNTFETEEEAVRRSNDTDVRFVYSVLAVCVVLIPFSLVCMRLFSRRILIVRRGSLRRWSLGCRSSAYRNVASCKLTLGLLI